MKLLFNLGRNWLESPAAYLLCARRWGTTSICFVQLARSALLTVNDRGLLVAMLRTRTQFDGAVAVVALLHRFLAYADALTGFALPRMPSDVAKMFMTHISPEWISRRPVGGRLSEVAWLELCIPSSLSRTEWARASWRITLVMDLPTTPLCGGCGVIGKFLNWLSL